MYNIYINNRSFYFFIKFVVTQLIIQNEDNQVKKQEYGQKRFARVSLMPGESKTVQVKLYTEQFGYYSNEGKRQWNIIPGKYLVKVGSSSMDIHLQESVTLGGKQVRKPIRDYYFSESSVVE